MRARSVIVTALALAAGSCFQIDPLPDCEGGGEGALHVRHHACLPLAHEPFEMPVAPRRLLRADFDNEGVDNDFAVLLDLGFVQIYTTRDQKTTLATGFQVEARIEAIAAARYFSNGDQGDDLFGVVAGDPANNLPGAVFGLHNGGDVFASLVHEQLSAFTLIPPGSCPSPNSVESIDVIGVPYAEAIAIGCESGPPPMDMPTAEPLDGILVFRDETVAFNAQGRLGLQMPELVGVHAVNVAQLDGLELEDIVLAHVPPDSDDHELAVFPISTKDMGGMGSGVQGIYIPLKHGAISRVLLDDLDGDADVDLVAIHPEGRGITVVRQKRSEPLTFEAPQFVEVGHPLIDAVIGDFTGDGGADIAVAHEVEGSGLNRISLLIRLPDLEPGQVGFATATAASISGEIIDLEPIDYDGDDRTDIAAVIKVGSEGRLHFWLNRSPAGT